MQRSVICFSESFLHSPHISKPSITAVTSIPIVPTTGGQGGNGPSVGLTAGVAVGVPLAVVVVVAIVMAVCSVRRRRRKFDLSCNGTYEVPCDAYIG